MKRRIGTYKNKILVENAGNELRNYEIAIEQLSNNTEGGGDQDHRNIIIIN